MIELKRDSLVFSFPEVHEDARFSVDFQRTLRIPDDGKDHFLPPGLGSFPVRHVDDFGARTPERWRHHGGVLLPMYQSEALWLNFGSGSGYGGGYPFAVKIATGKINAVSGEGWVDGLHRAPQDYVVVPDQPWLDGYCVEKGVIRQFVAMPLGSGYGAEEQLTGESEHGGIQILAYPMKAEAYEKLYERHAMAKGMVLESMGFELEAGPDMGLAPGGRMRQEIFDDRHDPDVWELDNASRCFVHIANSLVWQSITGGLPPTPPPTAKMYTDAGLPWFDYYDDGLEAVDGSGILDRLKSVVQLGAEKGDVPLPENASVDAERVIALRKGLRKDQVREGEL